MASYHLMIDESGRFSSISPHHESFVGGWICTSEHYPQIEPLLRRTVHEFNKQMSVSALPDQLLKFPNDMHFMPLHNEKLRTTNYEKISCPSTYVPDFFRILFGRVKPFVKLAFRSRGFPRFYANEQAAYIEVLRSLLLQLINSQFFSATDKIDIIIASRRQEELVGYAAIQDPERYERKIAAALQNELYEVFLDKRPKIKIRFGNAKLVPKLMMADFFCGALCYKEINYLDDYKCLTNFNFDEGLRYIGPGIMNELKQMLQYDSVAGLFRILEHLSTDPGKNELQMLFSRELSSITAQAKSILFEELIDYFHEKLIRDPARYQNLNYLENIIKIMSSKLPASPAEMTIPELRLYASMLKHKIIIASHKGTSNRDIASDYLGFLADHGDKTFGTHALVLQERIDAVLNSVQVSAFNSFCFIQVEDDLKLIRNEYKQRFPEAFDKGARDNNRARLDGTLGQMYGFLCDYNKEDRTYYEFAEDYLLSDIDACIPGTHEWEQGMGYLTSLYWKNEDINKCLSAFLKESSLYGTENFEDIFDLSLLDKFGTTKGDFFFLHRIYVCALAKKLNAYEIKNVEKAKNLLLEGKNYNQYPRFVIAKWLGIIYAMNADYHTAIELFNKGLEASGNQGFTSEAILLPIKMCLHLAMCKVGKKSNFNISNELIGLEKMEIGIRENLGKLGIHKYYNSIDNWNFWEIGVLLPFYYS